MNKAMVVVGIIILGITALFIINITQQFQGGNELDYYLLEETTEAAMLDAVDLPYYRYSGGVLRMDREKFVESFLRRFAANINASRNYRIRIIDLNETPPKVSVQVDSSTIATFDAQTIGISNKIDAILETKYNETRILEQIR